MRKILQPNRNLKTFDKKLRSVLKTKLSAMKSRTPDTDIDLDYLVKLFYIQDGKCIYRNTPLIVMPRGEREYNNLKWIPDALSIDRIDSSVGYFKGNVQFVGIQFNLIKQNLTNSELFKIAVTIVNNKNRYQKLNKEVKQLV